MNKLKFEIQVWDIRGWSMIFLRKFVENKQEGKQVTI